MLERGGRKGFLHSKDVVFSAYFSCHIIARMLTNDGPREGGAGGWGVGGWGQLQVLQIPTLNLLRTAFLYSISNKK